MTEPAGLLKMNSVFGSFNLFSHVHLRGDMSISPLFNRPNHDPPVFYGFIGHNRNNKVWKDTSSRKTKSFI
jgi:hypothetical protein